MSSQSPQQPKAGREFTYTITGCGGIIAPTHINALKQIPTARIVALCDINAETGKPCADELGAAWLG
ncbi:MAG: hypothetical protein ACUVR3_12990 [Candidatus Roseilinea sp.]|uniref:hypothetical protein n=1 Tax=Candidatus Roseilinea sp. TaxID=2838777 RepID=UPI00404A4DDB